MPVTKNEFASAVQLALPQAKVFWKMAPDIIFSNKPCALTATSISNPDKIFTLEMPEGIGQAPLDDVVKIFVEYFNNA